MRIGLILQEGGKDWIAGAVYLHNLLQALRLLPSDEQPSLYLILAPGQTVEDLESVGSVLPPVRRYTFRAAQSFRSKIKSTIRCAAFSHWPTSIERLAERLNLSVLFPLQSSLGTAFPRTWIGWIPDFQHKHLPRFFSSGELRGRDERFRSIVREASHVVVSSQDAYRDLMRWFPTDPKRVSVYPFVSVAAAEWYDPDPQEAIRRFGLPRKYLMLPSQFWLHKNHRLVFEVVRMLRDSSCPDIALVCTGRMYDYRNPGHASDLLALLKQHGLDRAVSSLGLLDRLTQVQLMRGAAAIIQPSLFEGWSALLEDAQTLGKAMYVSDIPVHREQNPEGAHFFNPESAEELATLIARDWNGLVPGPDRAKEEAARASQETRAIECARRFMRIARTAAQSC